MHIPHRTHHSRRRTSAVVLRFAYFVFEKTQNEWPFRTCVCVCGYSRMELGRRLIIIIIIFVIKCISLIFIMIQPDSVGYELLSLKFIISGFNHSQSTTSRRESVYRNFVVSLVYLTVRL